MNYPSDTSAGLHNGKFTGGDPNTGLPPSRLSADWMNAVSDELIAVITQFGGTPQENDPSQVSSVLRSADTALRTLIDNAVPAGTVLHIAAPEAPAGFIVCNGAQVDRTLYSRLFNLFFKNPDGTARFVAKTVTASVASPSVFTSSGHGFSGGERLRFSVSSGGTMPAILYTSGDYYVDPAGIAANTFYLLNAVDGTRVNITAAGTGTLSCMQSYFGAGDGSSTFNLPDLRGEFIRGWDNGRSADSLRTFGSLQGFSTAKPKTPSGFHNLGFFGAPYGGPNTTTGYDNTNGEPSIASVYSGDAETRPRNVALLPVIKY